MIRFSKQAPPSSMVGFPLLLIPLAVFNIIVFLMPGVSMTEPLFRLTLLSEAEWPVTLSDILLALGIVLLLLEVVKGARPGAKYLMDHLLSFIVFGAATAEFLLWPKFANSTFFLLTLLALVDFLAGIAQRTRRRVQYVPVVADPVPSRRAAKRAAAQAEAARVEPDVGHPASQAPAADTSRPSAASVAESVLSDHPAPRAQPDTPSAQNEHSPELQPSGNTPASPDAPQR
jgi:hypothetical protein